LGEADADMDGPKKPCIRWGPDPPRGSGNFWGCPAHSKALAVSAAVFAAKWIIQYAAKQKLAPAWPPWPVEH